MEGKLKKNLNDLGVIAKELTNILEERNPKLIGFDVYAEIIKKGLDDNIIFLVNN